MLNVISHVIVGNSHTGMDLHFNVVDVKYKFIVDQLQTTSINKPSVTDKERSTRIQTRQ